MQRQAIIDRLLAWLAPLAALLLLWQFVMTTLD